MSKRGHLPLPFRTGLLAFMVAFLAAFALAQDSAGEVSDAEFERIHGELTDDRDLQFDRPEGPATAEDTSQDYDGGSTYVSPFSGSLNALGPLAQVLFWGAIAVIVLGLLGFMVQRLARSGRQGRGSEGPGTVEDRLAADRPAETVANARLAEADRLADECRFAEAVHVLLFRSIEDIETERKAGLARSLTSREITALEELSARAREALRPITALVERGIFGAKPLGADDYASARAAYSDYAFGGAG